VAKKSKLPRQADPSRLPPYDEDGEGLHVVIETPKGSRNKYAFDKTKEIFALTKVLPAGMAFLFDFGFVPSTRPSLLGAAALTSCGFSTGGYLTLFEFDWGVSCGFVVEF